MPKCIELLPCDWLISNLCYQAIEQVYLIKWPVSVCYNKQYFAHLYAKCTTLLVINKSDFTLFINRVVIFKTHTVILLLLYTFIIFRK